MNRIATLIFTVIVFLLPLTAYSKTPGSALNPGKKQTGGGQTTRFTNPVINADRPDPTIWKAGNRFYCTSTGIREVLSSVDLVTWSNAANSPLSESARNKAKAIGNHFWAPDVVRIGNRWMLYLTCYNSSEDCGIVAFSSAGATGPFEFVGIITHSKTNGIEDTIDAEVVTDPESGKVWLFFGSIGKVHRIQLNRDGSAIVPDAEYIHVAGRPVAESPDRSKVFEGTYLHHRDGYWYMFVSSGKFGDSSYRIKVGRSRSLEGEFVDKDGKKMTDGYATTILSSKSGDNFFGPGHNGEIFTDDNGQDYMLYHCHNKACGKDAVRNILLQRIFWDKDGWPYFKNGEPAFSDVMPAFK